MATRGSRHRRRRLRLVGVGLLGCWRSSPPPATAAPTPPPAARRGPTPPTPSDASAAPPVPARGRPQRPPRRRRRPPPRPPHRRRATPPPSGTPSRSGPSAGSGDAEPTSPDLRSARSERPSPSAPDASPSSPRRPPADGTVGGGGPGAAWRSALASDLAQWSTTPACASQNAAPPASATAPVQYVVITEGSSGRPEAHTLTVTSAADKSAQLEELASTSGTVVALRGRHRRAGGRDRRPRVPRTAVVELRTAVPDRQGALRDRVGRRARAGRGRPRSRSSTPACRPTTRTSDARRAAARSRPAPTS